MSTNFLSQLNLCNQFTRFIASREHKVNINLPFSFLNELQRLDPVPSNLSLPYIPPPCLDTSGNSISASQTSALKAS